MRIKRLALILVLIMALGAPEIAAAALRHPLPARRPPLIKYIPWAWR